MNSPDLGNHSPTGHLKYLKYHSHHQEGLPCVLFIPLSQGHLFFIVALWFLSNCKMLAMNRI